MRAEYQDNPVYSNNPFIEALPLPLTNAELYNKLKKQPCYDEKIKTLSIPERLSCLSKIYETYIPPDYAPTVYQLLYQGIISSYTTKFSTGIIRQIGKIKEAVEQSRVPNTSTYTTQAISGSILGVSGTGKTSTILRILDLFPQVIEHTEYHGNPFFCKQITYLNIQCPNDCSVKAACIYILSAIDEAIGTTYSLNAVNRKSLTIDAIIAQISQLCITHHIGIIIIDEIQNILATNKKGENNVRLIKFFVQLMNDTGISVILVGTPEVGAFFDQQPHLARRTRGPRIFPMKFSSDFHKLVNSLWQMQCLKYYAELTDAMEKILFDVSGGIPALLAQCIFFAQQYAINSGIEQLSISIIQEAAALYQLRKPFPVYEKGDAAVIPEINKVSFPNKQAAPEKQTNSRKKGRPKILRDQLDILVAYENVSQEESLLEWMFSRELAMEADIC